MKANVCNKCGKPLAQADMGQGTGLDDSLLEIFCPECAGDEIPLSEAPSDSGADLPPENSMPALTPASSGMGRMGRISPSVLVKGLAAALALALLLLGFLVYQNYKNQKESDARLARLEEQYEKEKEQAEARKVLESQLRKALEERTQQAEAELKKEHEQAAATEAMAKSKTEEAERVKEEHALQRARAEEAKARLAQEQKQKQDLELAQTLAQKDKVQPNTDEEPEAATAKGKETPAPTSPPEPKVHAPESRVVGVEPRRITILPVRPKQATQDGEQVSKAGLSRMETAEKQFQEAQERYRNDHNLNALRAAYADYQTALDKIRKTP